MFKSYPENYAAVNLPSDYKPKAEAWSWWRTLRGIVIRDDAGKDVLLSAPVESVNPPDLDDPHWSTWHQNTYDFSKMKRTVQVFWRTPSSNDLLPLPITWEFDVPSPNPANATPDPDNPKLLVSSLPQGVLFRFEQTRRGDGGMLCDISFPANTFTGIAYQLVDANKALITGTPRSQMVTATDTGAGLGWATVPANARFAQFTFSYRNGGNLPFEFAIT